MAQGHKEDSTYCMPLNHARYVFEDALSSYKKDTLLNEMGAAIVLTNNARAEESQAYQLQLNVERRKRRNAQNELLNQQAITETYNQQVNAEHERGNKFRNQRNVGVVLWVATVVVFVLIL